MIRLRRKRNRPMFGNTVAATGWGESTFAELAWDKSRSAGLRWAIAGAVVGAAVALVAFAPAAWLARWVAAVSGERVLLADARGTVWAGSAVAVLTGGPGSRDASALPGPPVSTATALPAQTVPRASASSTRSPLTDATQRASQAAGAKASNATAAPSTAPATAQRRPALRDLSQASSAKVDSPQPVAATVLPNMGRLRLRRRRITAWPRARWRSRCCSPRRDDHHGVPPNVTLSVPL